MAWYLRLNGYFTMPNFIAHGRAGARTDVDVLGVRFPYSAEYPDDEVHLHFQPDKTDVVLAESKTGRCQLNGPWKAAGQSHALEYILRRIGIFRLADTIDEAAKSLYTKRAYEDSGIAIRIICFGSEKGYALDNVTQILWPEVLQFMNERFQRYRVEKADHEYWDSFGKYLWTRLGNETPHIADVLDGWNRQCGCWP